MAAEDHEVLQIRIPKADAYIAVNTGLPEEGGDLTTEVMREALIEGLKVILSRGMTKITKETYTDKEELKAAALAKAQDTFKRMRENDIRFMSGSKKIKEISNEVMVEARNAAKKIVKQWYREQGVKLAHVKTSEITKHANQLLASYPKLIEDAKAAVAARKETVKSSAESIAALLGDIQIDPKLVEKDEQTKANKKAGLSANKAGKVAFRAKPTLPGAQPTAH